MSSPARYASGRKPAVPAFSCLVQSGGSALWPGPVQGQSPPGVPCGRPPAPHSDDPGMVRPVQRCGAHCRGLGGAGLGVEGAGERLAAVVQALPGGGWGPAPREAASVAVAAVESGVMRSNSCGWTGRWGTSCTTLPVRSSPAVWSTRPPWTQTGLVPVSTLRSTSAGSSRMTSGVWSVPLCRACWVGGCHVTTSSAPPLPWPRRRRKGRRMSEDTIG